MRTILKLGAMQVAAACKAPMRHPGMINLHADGSRRGGRQVPPRSPMRPRNQYEPGVPHALGAWWSHIYI